jgi:hypothetical protein
MKTEKNTIKSHLDKARRNCRLQKKETDPALSGFTYILKEKPWKKMPIHVSKESILRREDY